MSAKQVGCRLHQKLVESRERSVEWSMVSKAALRSKETSKVD